MGKNSIVKFSFHGDVLDVLPKDGRVWVSVRRVCEALGVSYQGQIEKLKADETIGVKMILTPSDGGPQETACVDLDDLPLWLATIRSSKVKPEIREKLIQYKREAARVLADHFLGRRGAAIPDDVLDRLARIEAIEAQINTVLGMLNAGVPAQQVAGRGGARIISGRLHEYARLMASDGSPAERRRWRGRGEMELRGALNFVGVGRRWAALPIADFYRAQIKLEEMIRMARANAAARGTPNGVEQIKMFSPPVRH